MIRSKPLTSELPLWIQAVSGATFAGAEPAALSGQPVSKPQDPKRSVEALGPERHQGLPLMHSWARGQPVTKVGTAQVWRAA